jgi:lysophospholipase L1-like esterase
MKFRLLRLAVLTTMFTFTAHGQSTTVACVGNSLTAISGYVGLLDPKLGSDTGVVNCGAGGANMCRDGGDPYWNTAQFGQVFASNPDIITIMLGSNDTKAAVWDNYGHLFERDYNDMIDTFLTIQPTPHIVLVLPTPMFEPACCYAQPWVLEDSILPIITRVALERNLPLADCFTPFLQASPAFTDGVHFFGGPVAHGVANAIRDAINGTTNTPKPRVEKSHRATASQATSLLLPDPRSGATGMLFHMLDGRLYRQDGAMAQGLRPVIQEERSAAGR